MTEQILSDILEQTRDSNDRIQELDKKFELHKQRMEFEITKINELDVHQNRLIDEHILGVNTLKEMHVAHREESLRMINDMSAACKQQFDIANKRLQLLEQPSHWSIWLKQNKRISVTLVAILAGVMTVLKFWEQLSKLLGE